MTMFGIQRVWVMSCWMAFLSLCFPLTASAQLEDYDKGRLIDAMAKEGMADLLQRLVEVDPPSDPVDAKKIEIAQYRMRYDDASLSRNEQVAAYEAALQSTRELIDSHYDHEMRPLWQTDLAEMLLVEYLQVIHQNASQFYEFGVPTREQQEVFAQAVAEAYEATADADVRFFELRGELPRQPDHKAKRVNTGLWDHMIEEYYLKRTQFFLGHAAYYTALLPDDDAFYRNLSNNKRIINQKKTPQEERQRLWAQALRSVEETGVELRDDPSATNAVKTLTGRIRLRQGDLSKATSDFDVVLKSQDNSFYHLVASLGRVAVTLEQKEYGVAIKLLDQLTSHPLVANNLLYRLLLTDMDHRIRLTQAMLLSENERVAAIALAYQPYLVLLNDESLGEKASALRGFVYDRWASSTDLSQDLSLIPPMVRMAIGEVKRMEGQNSIITARQMKNTADEQAAVDLLDDSLRVNQSLMGDDIEPAIRATATYNVAMALYLKNIDDLGGLLKAAETFVLVAERHPGLRIGEQAIGDGMTVMRNLYALAPRPPGVDVAYRRAADVLFTQYPTSKAADDEHVYYAYAVLQQNGQYEEAIEHYQKVKSVHPSYFDAQREMLFASEHLVMQQPAGASRQQALDALQRETQRVIQEARAVQSADPDQQHSALRAAGGATLVQAKVADMQGQVDQSLAYLDGFEQTFAQEPDLVRTALERRIVILSAAGRPQPLADAATQMMANFPDDAAAVIDEVLTRIDSQIEQHRAMADNPVGVEREREAARQAMATLAQTAKTLAELLSQWAATQGFDADQMVAYDLIRVKVLLLASEPDTALELLEPIVQQYGSNDLQVMHYAGEAYYVKGTQQDDKESLIRAARLFDQIIGGVEAPYPIEYWNAWMRRLQINDTLGQFTDDIPLTVRRLEMKDPNLGGPRYAGELKRLALKYRN